MITIGQRLKFFPLQHAAWIAHCERTGADPSVKANEQAWRYSETLNVCGVESTADLEPILGFETIMLHWATISGDDGEIAYWSSARERRMKRRVRIAMQQLGDIEHRIIDWNYVRSIQYQMNIPVDFDDCPVELLLKVFQALDIHVKRLRRREAANRQTHAA